MRREIEMKTREEIVARLQAEYKAIQYMESFYEKVEGMPDKNRAATIYEYEVQKSYLRYLLEQLEIPVPENEEKQK